MPKAFRASWTLDEPEVLFGGKVVPSNGTVPGSMTPVVMLHDHGCVFDDFTTKEVVVIIKVHPYQQVRIEQPVVVIG